MVLSKTIRRCLSSRTSCLCRVTGQKASTSSAKTQQTVASTSSTACPQPDDQRKASIYVHWPYCARRCSYCNFNKYISKHVDHQRMADCLSKEAETLIQLSGIKEVTSIFFGGGTPSLALPITIGQVLDTVSSHVTLPAGSEVTLEANPTDLESSRLREFKDAGVNRLSLGIQALSDKDLKILGRDHSVREAFRCLEIAKTLYPSRVSVDLIFGRPGQAFDQWTQELNQMLSISDDHVSLYQLTLERGTQLFKWVEKGECQLPDNDVMADMYTAAVQILESHGFQRYEVSNFAKKGAESQHNSGYWKGQNYIGVGPGAHGRFVPFNKLGSGEAMPAREARIQTLEPDNWMFEVERYGHATRKIVQQTNTDRLEELLSLGLRMPTGVTSQRWNRVSSCGSLQSVFGASTRARMLMEEGLIVVDEKGLRATDKGLIVLDSVIPHLLLDLEQSYASSHTSSIT